MPKHEAWLRREVSVERASATTRIEGAELDEAAVQDLVKRGSGKTNLTEDEQANVNAIRAYRFVDYLSDLPGQPVDELAIRQLNREFLEQIGHDETPGEMPGMYRNGQNHVGNVYLPPDFRAMSPRSCATSAGGSSAGRRAPRHRRGHRAPRACGDTPVLGWKRPRVTGARNARTATLRIRFQEASLFREVSLDRRDEYFNAIERSLRGSYVEGYDATPWLEFWIGAIVAHTRGLADSLTDWRRMMDDAYRDLAQLDLNHRQVDALIYAIRAGRLTRSDYIEIAKVSPMTASRDLRDLADRGLLTAQGRTRDRVYLYVRGRPAAGVTPENQGCCSIPGRDKGNGAARVRTRGALRLRFARRRVGPPSRA